MLNVISKFAAKVFTLESSVQGLPKKETSSDESFLIGRISALTAFAFAFLQTYAECNMGPQGLVLQFSRLSHKSLHGDHCFGPRETLGQGKKKTRPS